MHIGKYTGTGLFLMSWLFSCGSGSGYNTTSVLGRS